MYYDILMFPPFLQNMDTSIREMLNEVRALIQEKQTQSPQTTLSPSLSRIELQAQTEYVFYPSFTI